MNVKYVMENIIKVDQKPKLKILGISLSFMDEIIERTGFEYQDESELDEFGMITRKDNDGD